MSLHSGIKECDGILEAIETQLGQYQSDLGNIGTEIRVLQEQSEAMNLKLRNRRALQGGLAAFIQRVALLPSLVTSVMQAPATSEEFSSALVQLDAKLAFIDTDEGVQRSAAFRDVAPELGRLRMAAVGRCRDLLMESIYELRRPRTNTQTKQAAMLRHKPAATFLRGHGGGVYHEVRAAYAEKVSGKLLDIFRSYWGSFERLEETRATADDLLGAPETSTSAAVGVSGVFSLLNFGGGGGGGPGGSSSGVSGSSSRAEVFALADRGAVLAQVDAPPMILHAAEAEGQRFPFEQLFRSLSKLLMDTAAHEYLFCLEFWGEDGRAAFRDTFAPVTAFVLASLGAAVQELHDPLALLLAIRINREHSLALARRAIPALDDHFDAVNLLFWPQLKAVLDAQLSSLKSIPTESLGDLQATRVHVMTERYTALTASVLSLHADILDGPLETNIERMRYAVMNLLLQMSRSFTQRGKGTVFLIHNFSHIVTALKDAGAKPLPAPAATPSGRVELNAPGLGAVGDAVLQSVEDSLSRATALYVDSRLTAGAPQLVQYVKRGEAAAAQAPEGAPIPGFGPAEAAPIAHDFSGRWERIVEVLNKEVSQDFGAGAVGQAVQQAAFTQLLLYWSRFLELLKRQGEQATEVARGAVSMPSIMYALKQHRLG